jgi:hypothetical protein
MLEVLRDAARNTSLPRIELSRHSSLSSAIPSLAAWGLPRLLRSTPSRRIAPAQGVGAAGSAVLLVLVGAASMYLFDPDRGAERRARARQFLADFWNRSRAALDDQLATGSRDDGHAIGRERQTNDRFIGV